MKKIISFIIIIILFLILFPFLKYDKYDYIIKNGIIVDGTGNPWYKADVAIKNDKIVKIGELSDEKGSIVIDASNKVVSPGFIDIHTHAGTNILDYPSAHNYIAQGVTSVVGGNCGGSKTDLNKFFHEIESNGTAVNFGYLIGHNSIRNKVTGGGNVELTVEQLEEMKTLVDNAMKAGALGLSTGLKYLPGAYTKTEEVIELAKVAAKYGGLYVTHLRAEGHGVIEAIREAITIGEKANIRVEISHLKVLSVDLWGKSKILLALIDEARQRGIDVKADQYPYTASSTGIGVLIPPTAFLGPGLKKNIGIPGKRKEIKKGIIYNILHERAGNDFNRIRIATCKFDKNIEGKGLKDILEERGISPSVENAAELVLELQTQGRTSCIYHSISDEDLERIIRHPAVMHASDGHIIEQDEGVPHPRSYGTFPRVLALYVREKGLLTLEEAIQKMTSLVAEQIGINDIGLISEGNRADIVIFDSKKIKDMATWENPHQYPEGIDYVFVNGSIAVEYGNPKEKRSGRILQGPGKENKY
ncbi:amidohydrolase family protein [candidate division KSB1 bacterium]